MDYAYCPKCHKKLIYDYYHYGHIGKYFCPTCDFARGNIDYEATDINLNESTIKLNGDKIHLDKNVLYAVYYTTAAIALTW